MLQSLTVWNHSFPVDLMSQIKRCYIVTETRTHISHVLRNAREFWRHDKHLNKPLISCQTHTTLSSYPVKPKLSCRIIFAKQNYLVKLCCQTHTILSAYPCKTILSCQVMLSYANYLVKLSCQTHTILSSNLYKPTPSYQVILSNPHYLDKLTCQTYVNLSNPR